MMAGFGTSAGQPFLYNLDYHVVKHWGEGLLLAANGLPHPLCSVEGLQRGRLPR